MARRPDQQARHFRDLAAHALRRDDFLELMQGQLAKGSNGSFRVRRTCVDASFVPADIRRLMLPEELETIDRWTEEARLVFPCSPEDLVIWAHRVNEDLRLPKEFLEAAAPNIVTPEGAEAARSLLDRLREDEMLVKQEAEMEALDYDGVRGLPPFWDWLPGYVQEQFRRFRDRLLSWDITPEDAVYYVRATAEDGVALFPAFKGNAALMGSGQRIASTTRASSTQGPTVRLRTKVDDCRWPLTADLPDARPDSTKDYTNWAERGCEASAHGGPPAP